MKTKQFAASLATMMAAAILQPTEAAIILSQTFAPVNDVGSNGVRLIADTAIKLVGATPNVTGFGATGLALSEKASALGSASFESASQTIRLEAAGSSTRFARFREGFVAGASVNTNALVENRGTAAIDLFLDYDFAGFESIYTTNNVDFDNRTESSLSILVNGLQFYFVASKGSITSSFNDILGFPSGSASCARTVKATSIDATCNIGPGRGRIAMGRLEAGASVTKNISSGLTFTGEAGNDGDGAARLLGLSFNFAGTEIDPPIDVPEPVTGALLYAGTCMIGGMTRRQRPAALR
jgi:hypothetical protein